MKKQVVRIDGEFWFTARYAAQLLGTSAKKVEAMAVRELLKSRQEGNGFLIAEAEVTRLRNDPDALAAVKKASKLPAVPSKGETMPRQTIYKGDALPESLSVRERIGNPLRDKG